MLVDLLLLNIDEHQLAYRLADDVDAHVGSLEVRDIGICISAVLPRLERGAKSRRLFL
jgi:hypothetical protein